RSASLRLRAKSPPRPPVAESRPEARRFGPDRPRIPAASRRLTHFQQGFRFHIRRREDPIARRWAMPLPSSLVTGKKPVTAGGLAPVGAAAAPPGGAAAVAPGADAMPFLMQIQLQDNWCWAATATSVSHFYNSASAWSQIALAKA